MHVTQPVGSPRAGTELFNRYMLPKVAFVLITIASFVGSYLTMTLHGGSMVQVLVRWLHLLSLGILAGGMMWWRFFMRQPHSDEEHGPVIRFALEQVHRFRTGASIALVVAVMTSAHLTWFAAWAQRGFYAQGFFYLNIVALTGAIIATAIVAGKPLTNRAFKGMGRWVGIAFGFVVLSIIATAVLDAELTFPGAYVAWILRSIHLLAFCLWLGGAFWNIFVAGPAAQNTLSFHVITQAANQLERFRWAVRVILPVLVLTGLAQAFPYTGLRVAGFLATYVGQLIVLKLGLVVALVGIFITCPLWRACSPIRGICDLEDLQPPAQLKPTQRFDNRGKGCAGFVHIQKALNGLDNGGVLEVLTTDAISWWELPAWLEQNGYQLLQQEKRGWFLWRNYRFLITYGERGRHG